MKTLSRTFPLLVALLAVSLLFSSGCSRNGQSSSRVVIKGSDTMVRLMSNLAEAYMASHPKARIAVTGGGSGTGIAALLNGTTDICAASRPLRQEEIRQAAGLKIQPVTAVIARDGASIVVNAANPVSELTIDQLKKIYTGEFTNWREVGGTDGKILALARESSSGTFLYFQEHVLDKADYMRKLLVVPSNAEVINAVRDDVHGIGYVGLAYAVHSSDKLLGIKAAPDSAAVIPSQQTVDTGLYPLSRPLFLTTNGAPSHEVKSFIDFCLSEPGQSIVTETGYITAPKP
jgi:phosphate transport system substrate-binding protein